MNFISPVAGTPLPSLKPVRSGAYSVLITTKGFVIGDPAAFDIPELASEISRLASGSGFVNGRLHLCSRKFPMYYPGSEPRLLLVSHHLTIIPLQSVPAALREKFHSHVQLLPECENPEPEVLLNVLPAFEIYEEGKRVAATCLGSKSS